ncbi:Rne/Rng family ribonuclease [Corynebacterium sp. 3HC-13]|nr:Rne/Rng family ribonuclease [Corynebacterium poyangense]
MKSVRELNCAAAASICRYCASARDSAPDEKIKELLVAEKSRSRRGRSTSKKSDFPDYVELAAKFDRSSLPAKTRVHALAKQLQLTSKELVLKLNNLGMVKVAMSTLSVEEANKILNHLATPAQEDTADKEPLKQIRHRVEKNVANEIHQIEEKVERSLSEAQESQPEESSYPLFMAPSSPDDEEDSGPEGSVVGEEKQEKSRQEESGAMRRGRRRAKRSSTKSSSRQVEVEHVEEPVALRGSTRLEAQRRRRSEIRDAQRRHVLSEKEFLARREAVERCMVVRERQRFDGRPGRVTQVGLLEDGKLVEHFVTSEEQASMIGNVYLGRVQNVLPNMEAAFIDIGADRNGVLYAGEVDWREASLSGKQRRIEQALHVGDQVMVQVTKDPIGQKGARLSTHISLAGRYLVYVPQGRNAGISRKLPGPERKRLKEILNRVAPEEGGIIIRTAAEGVAEKHIAEDVNRLHRTWEQMNKRATAEKESKGAKPVTLYEEPDVLIKVVRDLFNEDFKEFIVDGDRSWNIVSSYVDSVASDLKDRLVRFNSRESGDKGAFAKHDVDGQIDQGLARKVYLPSGGSLIIDRTEAMTVIDVNTGSFTGTGGNLEESVTTNNIEAAEEIVRQLRLRDIGGMIVIDFIDMVLPENQELVLRKLSEALERDRSRHQVSEVTSLGLVQMTRKRMGTGLLETFTTPCEACDGRGIIIHKDPVDRSEQRAEKAASKARRQRKPLQPHPVAEAIQRHREDELDDVVTPEEESTQGSSSIEDLAAAVIVDEAEEQEEYRPRRRRSTRRGGRGRGRGRGKQQESEDQLGEQTPADDHSDSADSQPNGTYEEAKEAFDRSPRRKLRTRGNSRSDYEPRPEDFEPAGVEADSDDMEHDDSASLSSRTVTIEVQESRRGRRRAVRRARVQAQRERRSEQKTKRVSSSDTKSGEKPATQKRSSGRGRRRAVRKMSRRG